jgi:transcriptional regulator with GAF, ATPase, and Fis domain
MSEVDTKLSKTDVDGGPDQAPSWEPGQASVRYLPPAPELSLRSFRDEAEIHAISSALKQTGWNRKQAARLLSISYRGLLYKIRRHNITPGNGIRNAVPVEGSKLE